MMASDDDSVLNDSVEDYMCDDEFDENDSHSSSFSDHEWEDVVTYDAYGQPTHDRICIPLLNKRRKRVNIHELFSPILTESTFELQPLFNPFRHNDGEMVTRQETPSPPPQVVPQVWQKTAVQSSLTDIMVQQEQETREEEERKKIEEERQAKLKQSRRQHQRQYHDQRRYHNNNNGSKDSRQRSSLLSAQVNNGSRDSRQRSSLLSAQAMKKNDNTDNRKSTPDSHDEKPQSCSLDRLCIFPLNHRQNCVYAHDFDEWKPRVCRYPRTCSKKDQCMYWHTQQETKREYLVRALKNKNPFFKNMKDHYMKTYHLSV
jgi:hypothetical protein